LDFVQIVLEDVGAGEILSSVRLVEDSLFLLRDLLSIQAPRPAKEGLVASGLLITIGLVSSNPRVES